MLAFPSHSVNLIMSDFFEELKRRKVYRVAVAYIIASGIIIQIASPVFPGSDLPNWSLRLMVLVLTGFPIALIFAWTFDVTPGGIKRTSITELRPDSHRRRPDCCHRQVVTRKMTAPSVICLDSIVRGCPETALWPIRPGTIARLRANALRRGSASRVVHT